MTDRHGDTPDWLVLGAGAWGTALACALARAGQRVRLWGRDGVRMAAMAQSRVNAGYLPAVSLPPGVTPGANLSGAAIPGTIAVLATPLQTSREVIAMASAAGLARFVCTAKGIETGSGRLVHEIVEAAAPPGADVAIVSGPSFAQEVALGKPTALTVAARGTFARQVANGLHSPALRPYLTDDLVGVALGGAVKNVLAIAAGIADGLDLGANSRAALITRGVAEMVRLGVALGGRSETFMGLSGFGDLVLTCTDDQSRNRRFGLALGRGASVAEAASAHGLVEGLPSAAAVCARAGAAGVEMPICEQVARTLQGECSPAEAAQALMTRELRST